MVLCVSVPGSRGAWVDGRQRMAPRPPTVVAVAEPAAVYPSWLRADAAGNGVQLPSADFKRKQ